jgi:transcriptional regulator with XRE-family HTH domain
MTPAEAAAHDLIDQLVELRRVRGLTQAEVADRIGISRPSVCMLERHYHGLPNIVTLLRYAEGVGAEVTVTVRRRQ